MQHCPKCNVDIRGNKACCPLCLGKVTGVPENPSFNPDISLGFSNFMVIRISIFLFVILNVVMFSIQILTRFEYSWPWVVSVMSVFVLVDIILAFYLRSNLINLISAQTLFVMVLIYVIDRYYTSYIGYSVTIVIPILFIFLLLSTIIIGAKAGMHTVDYIVHLLGDSLLSFFQIIPIVTKHNFFPILAVISIAAFVIYLAYVIIFRWRDLSSATAKYMNM